MKRFASIAALTIAFGSIASGVGAQVSQPLPPTLGKQTTRITSANSSTGVCYSAQTTPGWLVELSNTGPALTAYPQFYDEGSAPTCAASDLIYGDGTAATAIQAGQVILLSIPVHNGIAYQFATSGPLPTSQNLVVTRI